MKEGKCTDRLTKAEVLNLVIEAPKIIPRAGEELEIAFCLVLYFFPNAVLQRNFCSFEYLRSVDRIYGLSSKYVSRVFCAFFGQSSTEYFWFVFWGQNWMLVQQLML